MLGDLLLHHGPQFGAVHVPWSVVVFVAIVVVGLLIIRTVITLAKVALLVAVGVGVYLLIQYALNNFG